MRNKGNVALTQVAVSRIAKMWPGASLEVITSAPHLLRLYCPNARPVSPDSQYDWTKKLALIDRIIRSTPRPLLRLVFEIREEIRQRLPVLGPILTRAKLTSRLSAKRHLNKPADDVSSREVRESSMPRCFTIENQNPDSPFEGGAGGCPSRHLNGTLQPDAPRSPRAAAPLDWGVSDGKARVPVAVSAIDLFLATGAQYMSDACRDDALRVLERLETAHRAGIPTAMVGQGVGPFEDPELRSRARAVLPLVNLIFIRDRRMAGLLQRSLGVDPSHVIFTGDDAIEMAYNARSSAVGTALGVSLRMAHYTEVGAGHLELIRPVLHQATFKHRTRLIAIPISQSAHEMDDLILRQLLSGAEQNCRRFDTPLQIIKMVAQCRLVVTGAFHTAVFALSQGIPAIGLAKSDMYVEKFRSLADEFGSGCQMVYLGDEQFQSQLAAAIDKAWESAEQVRPQLLDAAKRQILLASRAYRHLYEVVESRNRVKDTRGERKDQCVALSRA
jgi:polysaccharide pyruvyl transferase WcaK-like protein